MQPLHVSQLPSHLNTVCNHVLFDMALADTAPTDLSVLPNNAPDLLSAPTATTPAFIAVSLGFGVVFFMLFTLISLRHKMPGKVAAVMDKPGIQRFAAWVGLLGFMMGMSAYGCFHSVMTLCHDCRPDQLPRHPHVVWKSCGRFQPNHH